MARLQRMERAWAHFTTMGVTMQFMGEAKCPALTKRS